MLRRGILHTSNRLRYFPRERSYLPSNHVEKNIHVALRRFTTVSSALHFYQNRQLELYAAKETKRLTLRQLVSYFGASSRLCLKIIPEGVLRTVYERGASHQGKFHPCSKSSNLLILIYYQGRKLCQD